MLTGVLTGVRMLIAIVVLGGATGSGASTRKGHAGRTPIVCAAKRQIFILNKIVFLVRIPWFVYLRVRIPWVRIPLVRIPLGGIPEQRSWHLVSLSETIPRGSF